MSWATVGLSLLSGVVGLAWGLSEIIDYFKTETGRALRTNGAGLLIGLNFVAAALIFLLVATLISGADNWLTAVLVGFAWPTIVRNTSFKLAQPLPSEQMRETASVRLEEAYSRIQELALQLINNALTRQRTKLIERAMTFDLEQLARHAHVVRIASPRPDDKAEGFIQEVLAREDADEIKKALLIVFILRFGRETLDDFVKATEKNPRPPQPVAQRPTAPTKPPPETI
jgi:hypothetical protein